MCGKKYIESDLDYDHDHIGAEQAINEHIVFQRKQIHSLMTIINKMHHAVSMSRAEPKLQRANTALFQIAEKINKAKDEEKLKEAIRNLELF